MYGYQIFHEALMKTLIQNVRTKQNAHAYIFEGEPGVGKLPAVRLFAASLVCENTNAAPCGSCPACIGAKAETNPDIRYIDTGDKKSIGVNQIREIITDAYVRPFESRKKVYVISEGDALTEEAQNAFLKVLEEPPQYTVFVILVSKASMLLQTIHSRCAVIRFPPLDRQTMLSYIEETYPDANREFLLRYAGGIPGNVDNIMGQEDFWVLRSEACKKLTALLSAHTISAYAVAAFLEENKEQADLILDFWQSQMRDILFIQSGARDLVINIDLAEDLKLIAGRLSDADAIAVTEQLLTVRNMLRQYVNLHAAAMYLALSVKEQIHSH
ncbi:MAG: hypothetical protein E7397_03215 [Ruminococcaceae bacterium]|nr:hypothetical protein [Oscillospiraceae bacterium]